MPSASMPEGPTTDGVLVSCLPGASGTARDTGGVTLSDEGRRSAELLEGIRTQLTVIRGYAGLLKRPASTRPVDAVAARIDRAVRQVADQLATYEATTQLGVQHPDVPT